MNVGQLKILQSHHLKSVRPFAYFYMKEPLKLDYLWAGLCILGAVYFILEVNLINFRLISGELNHGPSSHLYLQR